MAGKYVDILCVVDGETLLREFPNTSESSPATLTNSGEHPMWMYCRMVTRQRYALENNAQDDLKIYAKVGDTVRWRATSLTLDEEYAVDVIGFRSFAHAICPTPTRHGHDLWVTTIENPGEDTYWLDFKVIPSSDELKTGFFYWDPGIVAHA